MAQVMFSFKLLLSKNKGTHIYKLNLYYKKYIQVYSAWSDRLYNTQLFLTSILTESGYNYILQSNDHWIRWNYLCLNTYVW